MGYPLMSQVAYALLTVPPVAIKVLLPHDAPRLACVKPVASVHPEPGSNLHSIKIFIFSVVSFYIRIYSKDSHLLFLFKPFNICKNSSFFIPSPNNLLEAKADAKIMLFVFLNANFFTNIFF